MSEPITQGSTYTHALMPDALMVAVKKRDDKYKGEDVWEFRVRSATKPPDGLIVISDAPALTLVEEFIPPIPREALNAGRASRAGQVKGKKP